MPSTPRLYSNCPLARTAFALAEAAQAAPLIHVALDDRDLEQLAELLAHFHPDIKVALLPAWDTQPYDRVSPHPDILSQRVATLMALQESPSPPLLLTTVNAALQRVPPPSSFRGLTLTLRQGQPLNRHALSLFFAKNGYHRTATVREVGEFALRGNIIDFFPSLCLGTEATPIRLDLFGDDIESIRRFDAISQRTLADVTQVVLQPAGEVLFTDESLQAFRAGYRQHFGAHSYAVGGEKDPLYEAVIEGRHMAGVEQLLPLFYPRLATLFDYCPGWRLSLGQQVELAIPARQEEVASAYQDRLEYASRHRQPPPLLPEALYLPPAEWQALAAPRHEFSFTGFAAEGPHVVDMAAKPSPSFHAARQAGSNVYDAATAYVHAATKPTWVLCQSEGSLARLQKLLWEHGLPATVQFAVLPLEQGMEDAARLILTETDILGDRVARRRGHSRKAENILKEASQITVGDLVVHAEHGVGRYMGLTILAVSGSRHECLELQFAGKDKLFVPVENINILSRYGSEGSDAELDKLGGAAWQEKKARVKKRLLEMAGELLKIAAACQLNKAPVMDAPDTLYEEFCATFPYTETEDQLRAIGEVLGDLAKGQPMDRLVCGDVGFGKTEVALRAAFCMASSGWQVAVVVPTTLLARQHYQLFRQRLAPFGVKVAQLSRFVTAAEASRTKQGLRDGQVDVVVGTHALLAKSLEFNKLGLLVVDEEQHFGVGQKERLKAYKANVHVLTLTATPIPRTLQLSLAGIRDLSLISTPPVDRLAVRTFTGLYDAVTVKEALLREHFRGGQSFYVCPRIKDIEGVAEDLHKLVPDLKIAVAHGQKSARELEDIMAAFVEGEYNILLATHIIESGLDIPRANTLIIHRSDLFGLSQLYQLRGRVGRSKLRGYAYLTIPNDFRVSETAQRRLEVMQTLDYLGAGFTLASHDMDIRGAGNLLGEEQSGHIREVGVELYQHMLEEAVQQARKTLPSISLTAALTPPPSSPGLSRGSRDNEPEGLVNGSSSSQDPRVKPEDDTGVGIYDDWTPTININLSVMIPDSYVNDLNLRLALYRRMANVRSEAEMEDLRVELIDRFGPLPEEVQNLLAVLQLKALCRQANVEKIDFGPKGILVSFHQNRFANPEALMTYIATQTATLKLRPDQKLHLIRNWPDAGQRLEGIRKFLETLVGLMG